MLGKERHGQGAMPGKLSGVESQEGSLSCVTGRGTNSSVAPRVPGMSRLLRIALAAGIDGAVRSHIARGDSIECRDANGLTPLMVAAERNRVGVCVLLLDAGADARAVDSAGRNALTIAMSSGALAAAGVIRDCIDACVPLETESSDGDESTDDFGPEPSVSTDASAPEVSARLVKPEPSADARSDESGVARTAEEAPESVAAIPDEGCVRRKPEDESADGDHTSGEPEPDDKANMEDSPDPRADDGASLSSGAELSDLELTFGDWEPVSVDEPPENDQIIGQTEGRRQQQIDAHEPIDRSAIWEDFEAFLPEIVAKPTSSAHVDSVRPALRAILLRALREGSVPQLAIENLLQRGADKAELNDEAGSKDEAERNDDAEWRDEAAAALEIVIGDMGADLDERLQDDPPFGSGYVRVPELWDESEYEESQIDEAILHFEDLLSDEHDALRLYTAQAVRHALLSPEQEIFFAQQMENAVLRALDALSAWPCGLACLARELSKASGGAQSLTSIIDLNVQETDDRQSVDLSAVGDDGVGNDPRQLDEIDVDEPSRGSEELGILLERIKNLLEAASTEATSERLRQELGRLRFRRPFLLDLERLTDDDTHLAAISYRDAIACLVRYRNKMAEANLRLVLSIARTRLRYGLPIEDLIQDGNLGLLRAVDRFDWRRGFRFSTMATWWIKQQIGRNVCDTALAIRLPVHVHEKVGRFRGQFKEIERERGKPPSLAERAATCGIQADTLEHIERAFSDPLSIEEALSLGISDFNEVTDPFSRATANEEIQLVIKSLGKLKAKEGLVLRLRFGIGVPEDLTLDQVGRVLGVTRERARQIEAKAIRRLSSPSALGSLAVTAEPKSGPRSEQVENRDKPADPEYIELESDPASTDTNEAVPDESPAKSASPNVDNAIARIAPMTNSMKRLLDRANELGVRVTNANAVADGDYVFGEIDKRDPKARKLIRDLLEMGFKWQPGMGYRQ